jgi:hypothetical protein
MKKILSFCCLCGLLTTLGCDTFDRRSHEKAAAFAALPPASQEKLKKGVIEIGDSPDMVYIAMGTPDERRDSTKVGGREMTWIYNSYHQEYEGNVRTGYRRTLVRDPVTKRYIALYEPIYTDVYSDHREERIRIKFVNDRVTEIEQPKPRR